MHRKGREPLIPLVPGTVTNGSSRQIRLTIAVSRLVTHPAVGNGPSGIGPRHDDQRDSRGTTVALMRSGGFPWSGARTGPPAWGAGGPSVRPVRRHADGTDGGSVSPRKRRSGDRGPSGSHGGPPGLHRRGERLSPPGTEPTEIRIEAATVAGARVSGQQGGHRRDQRGQHERHGQQRYLRPSTVVVGHLVRGEVRPRISPRHA